ncbi:beta strand repeat-containing protein [Sulfoacidibacillus ferrooxidans]|uniref:Big-1 domain-containing protein n=1 Tax=Sulfoacidibacillus ferrooxidans TaxID=2005001 RepID=A0A9X1VB60_9BACL|nr:hypothetical protein [Sulfoacidibacillus ferrooxidans]MCI0183403.1 hypothetical protein [Sulfoacidibacillus ferrooxidans]
MRNSKNKLAKNIATVIAMTGMIGSMTMPAFADTTSTSSSTSTTISIPVTVDGQSSSITIPTPPASFFVNGSLQVTTATVMVDGVSVPVDGVTLGMSSTGQEGVTAILGTAYVTNVTAAASSNNVAMGKTVTLTPSFTDGSGAAVATLPSGDSVSYTVTAPTGATSSDYTLSGNTFTATMAGTYTITPVVTEIGGTVTGTPMTVVVTDATVSSVSAVNGTVTVNFSNALSVTPSLSDFSVTQSINGGTATTVTPTAIAMNSAMTQATLTVPTVSATAAAQSVVDSVAYNGGTAMSASAFSLTSAVNAANSSVTASFTNDEITNGSAYTVSESVEDAAGNPISALGTSDFTMSIGTQSVSAASVTNEGDGMYQVIFIPSSFAAGTGLTANFAVDGVTIGQVGGLSVVAGAPSLATSSVTFPSVSTLNAGGTYTMTLNLEDASGNPVVLTYPAVEPNTSEDLGATYSIADGTTPGQYVVTAVAPSTVTSVAGTMSFTVENGTTAVATFTSTQEYTVADEVASTVQASWSALPSTLTSGGSYNLTATVTDANGNAVTGLTSSAFSLGYETAGMTSPSTIILSANSVMAGTTAGTYQVSFVAPDEASAYSLVLGVDGVSSTSPASYTPGAAPTASDVGSSSTAGFPSQLVDGQTATFTVGLVDASGNALVLPSGYTVNLVELEGGTIEGTYGTSKTSVSLVSGENSIIPMTAGASTGQYSVTLTPSGTGNASGSFQIQVLDGSDFVAQVGSTQTYTLEAGTPAKANSTVPSSFDAIAGTEYCLPVTVADVNGVPVSTLTSSDFGLQLGVTPVSVTSVTQSATTPGSYMVNFMLPSSAESGSLTVSANGIDIGSSAVTVSAPSAESLASATSTDIALDTSAPTNTIALPSSGDALQEAGSYATLVTLTGSSSAEFPYLTPSDFSVTYGSSTTNLVSSVVPVSAASNQYVVVFNAPTATMSTAQALNISVGGVSSTAGTFTVSAPLSASNSSVQWMSGSALTAGQSVTVAATVEDANGNPVSTLGTSDFAVYSGSSTTNLVSSVAASSTAGQYDVTFVDDVASSTASPFTMYVNETGITGTSADTLIGTSGDFTVAPGAPSANKSTVILPSSKVNPGSSFNVTGVIEDAFGNPIPNATVVVSFGGSGGSSTSVTTDSTGNYSATLSTSSTSITGPVSVVASSGGASGTTISTSSDVVNLY